MVLAFLRMFLVLLIVSILFQVSMNWDELVRAGWPLGMVLVKIPAAAGVAFIAAGAVLICQRPRKDDDED